MFKIGERVQIRDEDDVCTVIDVIEGNPSAYDVLHSDGLTEWVKEDKLKIAPRYGIELEELLEDCYNMFTVILNKDVFRQMPSTSDSISKLLDRIERVM